MSNIFGYCCDAFYESLCTFHIKYKDKKYGLVSPIEYPLDVDGEVVDGKIVNGKVIKERFKFIVICPFCGKDVKNNLKLEK